MFRMLLCAALLPMMLFQSEAFVTNLRVPSFQTMMRADPSRVNQLFVAPVVARFSGINPRNQQPKRHTRPNTSHRHLSTVSLDMACCTEQRQRSRILPWLVSTFGAQALWLRRKQHSLEYAIPGFFLLVALLVAIVDIELSMTTVLLSLGRWYMERLSSNPMFTKAVSASMIALIGDCMAQRVERVLSNHLRQRESAAVRSTEKSTVDRSYSATAAQPVADHSAYDLRRGISVMADALVLSGPLLHLGYGFFEAVLPIGGKSALGSTLAAFGHVAADCLILDSFFVASTFITTGLMEGIQFKDLLRQFKADYVNSLKASWATSFLLCPIQFSCFRYLPLSFRVLSANFIDVIWGAVVSYMAHRGRQSPSALAQG